MPLYDYNAKVSLICTTAVIASSDTTTPSIDLQGHGLVAIVMPSAFTGTVLTFQASADNNTFNAVYNADGNQFTVSCGTNRYIAFAPADFVSARYLKIVSGSTEAGARTLCLILRGFV